MEDQNACRMVSVRSRRVGASLSVQEAMPEREREREKVSYGLEDARRLHLTWKTATRIVIVRVGKTVKTDLWSIENAEGADCSGIRGIMGIARRETR